MKQNEESTGQMEGAKEPPASSKEEPPANEAALGKTPVGDAIEEDLPEDNDEDLPSLIVAMGGSAGSLEAFQEFLRGMPEDTGMAFVVISHMDPTRKDLMPEILQRFTKMNVQRAEAGMKALPDNVYVTLPNKDLSLEHGQFQLYEPSASRSLRMPIDFFFRHLAEDQRSKSVGIVFSGTGTDGTLGIRSLKEKLGLAMAQDPNTASYKNMPESAIATGMIDYVAPASELPSMLFDYLRHVRIPRERKPVKEEKSDEAIEKILALIRAETGNDFSLYKKSTIRRRIDRRMAVHQIDNTSQYLRYLHENPQEVNLLFKELLIGVTSFFRDPEAFESLKVSAVPKLLDAAKEKGTLRAWVVGCSTGEEAYTLAIVLLECLDTAKLKGLVQIQIYATDIDKDSIDRARQGVYPANIVQDVSPERLQRFFVKDDDRYRVKKEVRDLIVFAQQNVISDPPFTKLDLLSCRNLLIYLSPDLQKKIVPLFHYSLNAGGILFLGSSETVGNFVDLFSPIDSRWRLFQRRDISLARNVVVEFPRLPQPRETRIFGAWKEHKDLDSVSASAEKIILEKVAPPVVLINENGDLLYFTRPTGKYLEPPVGKANMNIFAMAREGLGLELGIAVRKAIAEKTKVVVNGVKVRTNEHTQTINLTVEPLKEPASMRGLLMVVLEDVEAVLEAKKLDEKSLSATRLAEINAALEKELQVTKQHLQSVIEDAETTQEELKSANEELQSTNEEMQSTNEELNTSREEMQSLNEELSTLNSELQAKNEELTQINNDLTNLLNSTQIPVLFLDNHLNIKRFTSQMTKIANLIPSDLERPITDIAFNLQGESVVNVANSVLENLMPREDQVQNKDGRWYIRRVMPYRTIDNTIEGVVITFTDITERKILEDSFQKTISALKDRATLAEGIVENVKEPLIVLNGGLKVVKANRSFYGTFHTKPDETIGKFIYDLGNRQWDIPELRRLLEEALSRNISVENYPVEHDFPGIGMRKMILNARWLVREGEDRQLILLAIRDVSGECGDGAKFKSMTPKRLDEGE